MIWLDDQLHLFPSPLDAPADVDIIAIGGDLNPKRLLLAYSLGMFPWYNEGETPILWQSPNPRFVLFPDQLKVNRSLRRSIKRSKYEFAIDRDFNGVLQHCASVKREGQDGTWLNPSLIQSLTELHTLGYAHSFEARLGEELIAGLYGISIGGVFFGESMFTKQADASKITFVLAAQALFKSGFKLIDCQAYTEHLERFGAMNLSRDIFHALLREYTKRHPKFPHITHSV